MPDAKPAKVAAVERHATEGLERGGAADGVERDVDAPAVGRRPSTCSATSPVTVVDREVGAELPAQRELHVRARGRDDAGTDVDAELDRGRARPTRTAVHQQRLVPLQPAAS